MVESKDYRPIAKGDPLFLPSMGCMTERRKKRTAEKQQRQEKIRSFVESCEDLLTMGMIAKKFLVSEYTVRRDLKDLGINLLIRQGILNDT